MDRIKQILDKVEESVFSGVVSLVENGKRKIFTAKGYRDIINKLENDVETRFGIASGTKFFTALGVGVLIDRGYIKLDSKVWDILGGEPKFIGENATVKQLLNHTSGTYDYLDEEQMDDDDFDDDFDLGIPLDKLKTPSDFLPLFLDKKPKFQPGERCSYSNGGYVLLGVIIEKVTGELFRDFITREVLMAAGMEDSGFYFLNDLPENSSIGYKEENGKLVANYYSIPIVGGADGGMFTTLNDLEKIWNSFISNKILSRELTELFMTPCSKVGESDYGLGMYITEYEDSKDIFLYGCDPGVGFHSRFNVNNGRLINIISNRTWGIKELDNLFWEIGI